MKKTAAFFLSTLMIFAITITAMGASTTIHGEMELYYKERETNGSEENFIVPPSDDSDYGKWDYEKYDRVELWVRFDTKYDDHISTRFAFTATDGGAYYSNQYWGKFVYDFATFQFGCWSAITYEGVDIIEPTYQELKGDVAALITVPLGRGFSGSLIYYLDGKTNVETLLDGAYLATLSYKTAKYGGDLNLVDTAERTGLYNDKKFGAGYTVNAWFKPVDMVTVYLHHGVRDVENSPNIYQADPDDNAKYWRTIILGVSVTPAKPPLTFRLEYDFDKKQDFCAWDEQGMNQWGFSVLYTIAPNVTLSYARSDTFTSASPSWPYSTTKSPRGYDSSLRLKFEF